MRLSNKTIVGRVFFVLCAVFFIGWSTVGIITYGWYAAAFVCFFTLFILGLTYIALLIKDNT
jgi:hypothetical protein